MRVYLLMEGARANRTTARKPGPLYIIQYYLVTLQLLSLSLSQAGIIRPRHFFFELVYCCRAQTHAGFGHVS